MKCTCSKVISFAERFKTLQLINGIYDKEIQEKVLAAGAALSEGQEMALSDVIKMVQSCQMGKTTHAELSRAGNINRISEHRKKKDQGRQEKRDPKPGSGGQSQGQGGCGFCGRSRHPREECPAREKKCNNCGIDGHFSARCHKKAKDKAKVAEVTGEQEAAAVVSTVQAADYNDDFFGETASVNRVSASKAP